MIFDSHCIFYLQRHPLSSTCKIYPDSNKFLKPSLVTTLIKVIAYHQHYCNGPQVMSWLPLCISMAMLSTAARVTKVKCSSSHVTSLAKLCSVSPLHTGRNPTSLQGMARTCGCGLFRSHFLLPLPLTLLHTHRLP